MNKYSFVIPVYENKKMLRNSLEALNHLEACTTGSYEAIVVDDGSSDNIYNYIKDINTSYELKYLYLERCADSCRSRARNHGVKMAEAEVIIFIDADIIVKKDYLREVDRYFQINGDIVLLGPRLMLPEAVSFETVRDGSVFGEYAFDGIRTELHEFRHGVFNELSYNAAAIKFPFLYGQSCNIVVPKRYVERAGGFDEQFKAWGLEDIELACKLWKEGMNFIISTKIEVLHQFHWIESKMVEEDKIAGVEENTRLFLAKHPNVFDIPCEKVYELFKSLANRFWYVEKRVPQGINRVVLDFKDRDSLGALKNVIGILADTEGLDIVVTDYVEDTDLDIWIQLLKKTKSTPRYYPASRRLIMQQAQGRALVI